MKVKQIITDPPHLYLDMDGVQADFFTAWANMSGKNRYKDIGDRAAREASIDDLNRRGADWVEDFFTNLRPLPGGQRLVAWLRQHQIPFTVLSAPLRGNADASIRGKITWLDRYNPGTSAAAIFTSEKERLAQHNGRPAVLVDDYKPYVQRWRDAGGHAILYRDHQVDDVIDQLAEIYHTQ